MSRENAAIALQATIASAFAWAVPPSRQLKLWTDVPKAQRPCAFLFEGGNETFAWTNTAVPRRTMEIKVFVYIDSTTGSGATRLNTIMESIDTAMMPKSADLALGRSAFGGAAYQFRIDGNVFKDPGDLDGDGMLIVPIRIFLP